MNEDDSDSVDEIEQAEIEIQLHWHSGKQTVRTVIEKETGDLRYSINGEEKTQDEVAEMAKGTNICTGNMCQFLSQEKVGQFARMDPKVLFM